MAAGTVDQLYKYSKEDVELQIASTRSELMKAATQGTAWLTSREDESARFAGAAIQSGLTSFARFLQNFSGIVEIAKAADQQYGGLAYGTLSLLLCVVARKSQHEETYLDSFEELSYAFPRLETLLRMDPHERLERLIATTFAAIVRFARQTAQYYSSRRQRWKAALRSEGEEMRGLTEVCKGLNRIREECDIFMLQQISDLKYEVAEMKTQLKSTDAGVHRTERHLLKQMDSADVAYLATLRTILGVKEISSHTDLASYGKFLQQQFSAENLHLKHCHPRPTSMQLLEDDDDFHQWWEAEASRVFLAGGTNCAEDHTMGAMNWMSIGAVLTVEQLRKEDKNVAFFFSQTSHAPRKASLRTVMASIVYQLAEMHDHRLRSKLDRIQDLVSGASWSQATDDDDNEAFLDQMQHALLDLFSAFEPNDEINIVLDRLDQCNWGTHHSREILQTLREVLQMLLRVITHAACRVKVLLTVDSWYSRGLSSQKLGGLLRKERERLLLKADWVQEVEDDDD